MTDEIAPAANTSSTATQRRAASGRTNDQSNGSDTAATASTSTAVAAPTTRVRMPLKLLSKLLNITTILLRVALWPFSKLINTILFPPKEYDGINNTAAADRAARAFVSIMRSHISAARPTTIAGENEQYIEPDCPFLETGYTATMSAISNRDNPPLVLIYLHSPLHRNGDKFINNYLCHGPLLELLNSNTGEEGSVVCFGSSIHSAEGQRLREMLDVTSFPFMALLSIKSSTRRSNVSMELVLRLEGEQVLTIPPQQITTYLSTSLSRHAETMAQALAARLAREEEIRLREEQDREYQEALLADQIREIERREEQERLQKEEEERVELERLAVEVERNRIEKARELVAKCEEPSAGAGTARIRFTLPNGKKVDRRFKSEDTIEVLRAFLITHFDETEVEMKNFGISTNFPRKTFHEDDNGLTLDQAGLTPQAVVMVQDLDA